MVLIANLDALPRTVSFTWDTTEAQWLSVGKNIPTQVSEGDREIIRQVMYQSFKDAYQGFAVTVTEGDSRYRVRIGYSHSGNGDDCDSGTLGSTTLSSDVYLCAAFVNAATRGRERNKAIAAPEIIQAVGIGLGRSAAHEFYHQLSSAVASQRHTNDPTDIMWGTNPGESPDTIPWELYYGHQEFKEERKAVLRKLISHSN